ncbi:MAG: hypothetical protein INF81_02210 [Roseomonas sp.]|nr:hypothetical protein [Roseomonas sp.]MCA3430491.1 hypothetical protein [Roseomonas sp.]MCA3433894.1 hypothetical protein [Roseomonas sp.]
MITAHAQGCQTLLAALHEAGHVIVMASLGFPLARATARQGRGMVTPDSDKAAILATRSRRRLSGPAPRAATAGAQLALMASYAAGGCAVALREATRPQAAWQPYAGHYRNMSRDDSRGWYGASERLYAMGLHGSAIGPLVVDWVDATLVRHASAVATVAAALFRRGLITGPEIDRLLDQVTADPEPTARMLALAQRIVTDPGWAWPVVDGCTPSHL